MEVEDVAREGFTARRTTQQQGHLAVGHGLLGQIVIDDQRVFTAVAEVLAHGAAGVGGEELHRGRIGGAGGDHDGVLHGAVLFELAHHVGDGRLLLTDGHVDTGDAGAFLVDDRVDGDRRLTDLTVADDQLALTAADRHHGIDGLETGLDRLVDGLTSDDARCDLLDRVGFLGAQVALAVDGVTEGVDHTAAQFGTHRHLEDATGTLGSHALFQLQVITQNHGTDVVALEVQGHPEDAAGEFDHLTEHCVGEAVNLHDTVRYADDRALITGFGCDVKLLDTLLDDVADLGRIQLLHAMSLRLRRKGLPGGGSIDHVPNRR